jgi:hypothetical protein
LRLHIDLEAAALDGAAHVSHALPGSTAAACRADAEVQLSSACERFIARLLAPAAGTRRRAEDALADAWFGCAGNACLKAGGDRCSPAN